MKKIIQLFCLVLIFSSTGTIAQIDLTSNLKVCMPFTGNANDLSGNNFNGVVTAAVLTTDRFGAPNKAYQFDRNLDSHIAVYSFSNIALTNELTISMWAKSDVTTSNCLFILDPDVASDRCVGCAQYINAPTMMIWDYGNISTGGRVVVSSIPVDVVNWHHYVFTISQSGNTKKTYLDGVMNSSGPYAQGVLNKNKPFFIGGGYSNGSNTKIMWTGKIDDICIYNRALTQNEVTALFTATAICAAPTPTDPPPPPTPTNPITPPTPTNPITPPTPTNPITPPTPTNPPAPPTVTTVINPLGFPELKKAEQILVYPTISEGLFNVINNGLVGTVEVYAMDGKLIKTINTKEMTNVIDLSGFEKGIYLLKVSDKERHFTQKIIKN